MPKSPHDTLALLVLLGSFLASGPFLAAARRRYTDVQRQTLSSRGFDPVVIVAALIGVFGGYYFAPSAPYWAVLGVTLCAIIAAYRIARLHRGLAYSSSARVLTCLGLAFQLIGPIGAVILRASK
jgi:hypothetical protein